MTLIHALLLGIAFSAPQISHAYPPAYFCSAEGHIRSVITTRVAIDRSARPSDRQSCLQDLEQLTSGDFHCSGNTLKNSRGQSLTQFPAGVCAQSLPRLAAESVYCSADGSVRDSEGDTLERFSGENDAGGLLECSQRLVKHLHDR